MKSGQIREKGLNVLVDKGERKNRGKNAGQTGDYPKLSRAITSSVNVPGPPKH